MRTQVLQRCAGQLSAAGFSRSGGVRSARPRSFGRNLRLERSKQQPSGRQAQNRGSTRLLVTSSDQAEKTDKDDRVLESASSGLAVPRWQMQRHEKQVSRASAAEELPGGPVLGRFRVVLVSPKTAANVGSAARLCSNFECSQLCIVDPRCEVRSEEAVLLAVGAPALASMTVVGTLAEALEDATAAVGFTRRMGSVRSVSPSVAALLRDRAQSLLAQDSGTTALVFGREDHGLKMDELEICTELCALPTGRVQPSLNLSHSVGIALANVFEAQLEQRGGELESDLQHPHPSHGVHQTRNSGWPAATMKELDYLVSRWQALAGAVGMRPEETAGGTSHYRRRLVSGHLRNVMSRARINRQEVQSIHGLIKKTLTALSSEDDADGSKDK